MIFLAAYIPEWKVHGYKITFYSLYFNNKRNTGNYADNWHKTCI